MSAPAASYRSLRLERDADVVRLVLDRPPLNVLDRAALAEFEAALAEIGGDEEMRVLVLAAAGKAFCAGVDVADHLPDRLDRTLERFGGVVRRLLAVRAPVVAAVHGAALGGGCELTLASDVVLAREDAHFGVPEVRLGALPPVAAVLLPRLVGHQRALDLILSGRIIDAAEARQLGLASHVYREAEFDQAVSEYVGGIAGLSRPVVRLAKRALTEGLERSTGDALDHAETLYRCEGSFLQDAREGLEAFMEKREPVWSDA